ncbi:MAG: hypothetical protein ACRDRY_21430, partial [Pseudonocardiaceae bacterium]
ARGTVRELDVSAISVLPDVAGVEFTGRPAGRYYAVCGTEVLPPRWPNHRGGGARRAARSPARGHDELVPAILG